MVPEVTNLLMKYSNSVNILWVGHIASYLSLLCLRPAWGRDYRSMFGEQSLQRNATTIWALNYIIYCEFHIWSGWNNNIDIILALFPLILLFRWILKMLQVEPAVFSSRVLTDMCLKSITSTGALLKDKDIVDTIWVTRKADTIGCYCRQQKIMHHAGVNPELCV